MTPKKLKPVVLVTVSGKDAPGITSEITGVLSLSDVTVLDIGQSVIMGLLSLSILFEMNEKEASDKTTIKDLLFKAAELGLKLEFQVLEGELGSTLVYEAEKTSHYAITLIADKVSAKAIHQVTAKLAFHHLNIDTIERLSEKSFSAVEFQVSSRGAIDQRQVKKDLLKIARQSQVDIALQAEGLFRRSKRMVVFDMDSTLIQNEVIDEFARQIGKFEDVSKITREAMNGQIDFNESLTRRVSQIKGLTTRDIDEVFEKLVVTPGAQDLIHVLQKIGYKVAIISGGFSCIANRLKDKLGINYAYSNQLEMKEGKATGNVIPPIVNAQRKADLLDLIAQQEKIELDQVIAIGDGANDLLMLEKAGLGIAFNAKPIVSEKADLSFNQKNLMAVSYLLGIPGRDLQEALSKR